MPTLAVPDGKLLEFYLKAETAFGTPPSGNHIQTFIYSEGLAATQPLENDPLLGVTYHTARDATEPAPGLVSASGPIEVPLDLNHIGWWLAAIFGAPVTTGSGPYTHVFKSGAATLPTLCVTKKIAATKARQHTGLLVRSARFSLGQAAGYRRVALDTIFKDTSYPTSPGLGTPAAALARVPFPAARGVLKIDGVNAARMISVDANYVSGFEEERFLEDAATISQVSPGATDAQWTGSMRLRWMDATYEEQALAGTASRIDMVWEISTNLSLALTTMKASLERHGAPVGAPGRIESTVNFRGWQNATDPMVLATLKNSISGYAL